MQAAREENLTLFAAEEAYARRDYQTARRLFRELLTQTLDETIKSLLRFREAECALELHEFDAAEETFRRLSSTTDPEIAVRARSMVGLTFYRRGEYLEARSVWDDLARITDEENLAAQVQYALGWCTLRIGDRVQAEEDFRRVLFLFPDSESARRAEEMLRRLSLLGTFSSRSPRTARWLSTFLPGSGQVYAGRIGNGCVSFLLNGLVAYALGRSVAKRHWMDAIVVGVFGSRFYFGGRQNAARFAVEWNQRKREQLLQQLDDLEP